MAEGSQRSPEAQVIESINPVTHAVVGSVPVMARSEVDAALARARHAAEGWAALPLRARSRHLLAIRRSVVARADDLVATLEQETGKAPRDTWVEIAGACVMLTYAATHAVDVLRPRAVPSWPILGKRAVLRHEPYGVIGAIIPWNYPVVIAMQSVPFALAAGNTVLLKPSELASLTGVLLGEVVNEAGRDLVHVVTGDGTTGEALVRSGVDKVVFTGSEATARRILEAAAERLTPVAMELGGKDAMIVCDDADLRRAARTAVASAFVHAGQACMATERVLVHRAAYRAFVDLVVGEVRRLRLGSEPGADVGPMARPAQIAMVQRRIDAAVAGGATVAVGGRRRDDLGNAFLEPTVVVDVAPEMELLQEESFAPVLSIMAVADDAQAIQVANGTGFGLNASVFSADQRRAREIANGLITGGVNVNDALFGSAVPALPFGGVGRSGYGRLQGREGFLELSRTKALVEPALRGLPGLAATLLLRHRPSVPALRRMVRQVYG